MTLGSSKEKSDRLRLPSGVVPVIICIGYAILLAYFFTYYFDLNDDTLMKDILSGIYTGTPESYNIQMLWPISAFISLLYRIFGGSSVYGIFLLVLQFGALALILYGVQRIGKKPNLLVVFCAFVLSVPLLLYHMVMVQYTITTGMIAAAATALFASMRLPALPGGECGESDGEVQERKGSGCKGSDGEVVGSKGSGRNFVVQFIMACLPSVLLIWLGFLLRSEMMLYMLPLVLTAALFNVLRTYELKFVKVMPSIVVIFLLIAIGLGAGYGTDQIACASTEWTNFNSFFDARTQLYDFVGKAPVYEENEDFYKSIDFGKSEVTLLENYNFGLDTKLDEQKLWEITDYAVAQKNAQSSFGERVKSAMLEYRAKLTDPHENPYNILMMMLYGIFLLISVILGVSSRNRTVFWSSLFTVVFLAFVRTGLWMYIVYCGRAPERLTHSLYLNEAVILGSLLYYQIESLRERMSIQENGKLSDGASTLKKFGIRGLQPQKAFWAARVLVVLICAVAIWKIPQSVTTVQQELSKRAEINLPYQEYLAYCKEHPENFYFTDVYSTTVYSEQMFDGGKSRSTNRDLMGGWSVKSPLYDKKLSAYGISSMEEALLGTPLSTGGQAYIVAEVAADMSFVSEYYKEQQGISVEIKEIDRIADAFCVYAVQEMK